MSAVSGVPALGAVLAQEAGGNASPIGLFILLALGACLFVMYRSMRGHLRSMGEMFPTADEPPATERAQDDPAEPPAAGQ